MQTLKMLIIYGLANFAWLARTLYKTKLDDKYLQIVKDNCPQLLEKPNEETEKQN